jgi:hypothetical protein
VQNRRAVYPGNGGGGFERFELMVVGRKGKEYFRNRSDISPKHYDGVTSQASYGIASLAGTGGVAGLSRREPMTAFFSFTMLSAPP